MNIRKRMREKKISKYNALGRTSKKNIINFMNIGKKMLNEIDSSSGELFFVDKDEKIINSWSSEESVLVAESLCLLFFEEEAPGFSRASSPFCLYIDVPGASESQSVRCSFCEYGHHHGVCSTTFSDLNKIKQVLSEKKISPAILFSQQVYSKMIHSL